MHIILVLITMVVMCLPVSGQNKAKKAVHTIDTITIFHDVFWGTLPSSGGTVGITLQLDHKQYADDGNFTLDESFTNVKKKKTTGDWTVLRGDAMDDNATVVELDAPARVLYFLRRKDGSLQQLDSTYHEIKPVANYILRKGKKQAK